MAVEYIVNGTTVLKSQRPDASKLSLVPYDAKRPSAMRRAASLLSGVQIPSHEKTVVDSVLDDFSGTRYATTLSDKVFGTVAVLFGAAVLIGVAIVSAL